MSGKSNIEKEGEENSFILCQLISGQSITDIEMTVTLQQITFVSLMSSKVLIARYFYVVFFWLCEYVNNKMMSQKIEYTNTQKIFELKFQL